MTAHGRLTGKEPIHELDPMARDFLAKYKKYVTEYYGQRCKTRAPGCACCEAWALYDLTETMTV
jgi:hypothetical protein